MSDTSRGWDALERAVEALREDIAPGRVTLQDIRKTASDLSDRITAHLDDIAAMVKGSA